MKLVVVTQVLENYGTRWKPKGGSEYVMENLRSNLSQERLEALVGIISKMIEHYGEGYLEFVVDWFVEDDDYVPWFEKNQLEFEGVIESFEPRVDPVEMTLSKVSRDPRGGYRESKWKFDDDYNRTPVYIDHNVGA